MNINRKNYEVWMIDYFDGKLNATETAGLMEFLDANPDLKEELDLFENEPLEAEEIQFERKTSLKKKDVKVIDEITEENYEEYFLAFYEKDLNETQKESLNKFLDSNPHLKNEFKLHASLILQVENTVIYEQKDSLKKNRRVAVYWWSGAAAAVFLLLFGILSLIRVSFDGPNIRQETLVVNSLQKLNVKTIGETNIPKVKFAARETPQLALLKMDELANQRKVERFFIAKLEPVNSKIKLQNTASTSLISTDYTLTQVIFAYAETSPEPEKKRSLLGKVIKNFASRLTDETPEVLPKTNKNDPGFVKILDQGITVFNTITGSDTELRKSYDTKGNLTHYQVDGQSLSWSRNIDTRPSE